MILNFQTGKRGGGADEIEDDEMEEAQQMKATATDVLTFVYLKQLSQDVLARLFKLLEYLKARDNPTCIDLAKKCHSTIL